MCRYKSPVYSRCGHTAGGLLLSQPCSTYLSWPGEIGGARLAPSHTSQPRRSLVIDENNLPWATPCPSLQQFIRRQVIPDEALPLLCPTCFPGRPARNPLYCAYAPPATAPDLHRSNPGSRSRCVPLRDVNVNVNLRPTNHRPTIAPRQTKSTKRVSSPRHRPTRLPRQPRVPVAPAQPPETTRALMRQTPLSTNTVPAMSTTLVPSSVTMDEPSFEDFFNDLPDYVRTESPPLPPPEAIQPPESPVSWEMLLNSADRAELLEEFDCSALEAQFLNAEGNDKQLVEL